MGQFRFKRTKKMGVLKKNIATPVYPYYYVTLLRPFIIGPAILARLTRMLFIDNYALL
jgi:hypothetical protein